MGQQWVVTNIHLDIYRPTLGVDLGADALDFSITSDFEFLIANQGRFSWLSRLGHAFPRATPQEGVAHIAIMKLELERNRKQQLELDPSDWTVIGRR